MITSSARQTRFRSRKATTNSRPSKTFVLNFRKAVFYVRWSKKERTFWGTGLGTVFTGNAQCVFSKNSGAGDGIRTRNPQLGKLILAALSVNTLAIYLRNLQLHCLHGLLVHALFAPFWGTIRGHVHHP